MGACGDEVLRLSRVCESAVEQHIDEVQARLDRQDHTGLGLGWGGIVLKLKTKISN